MTQTGEISVRLYLDDTQLHTGLASARGTLSTFGTRMGGMLKAAGVAGGIAAGYAIVRGLKGVIESAAAYEQTRIAFTNLLGGSASDAQKYLGDLAQFAARTPFSIQGVEDSAKKLLAFGFDAEDVIPILTTLGDAASAVGGDPQTLESIIRAIGQIRAKGKVMAQEMSRQLTETGIPAWELLAENLGVSIPEAQRMAEAGLIDADTGISALLEGMNERYGGMMGDMAETVAGKWQNLKDQVAIIARQLGTPFNEAVVSPILDRILEFTDRIQEGGGLFGPSDDVDGVLNAARKLADEVMPTLQEAWSNIREDMQPALESMREFTDDILPTLQVLLEDATEWWKAHGDEVQAVIEQIGASFSGTMQMVGVTGRVTLAVLRRDWGEFGMIAVEEGEKMVARLISAFDRLLQWFGDVFGAGFQQAINQYLISPLNQVISYINEITGGSLPKLQSLGKSLGSSGGGAGSSSLPGNNPGTGTIVGPVPQLASGGVVTGPSSGYLAMLHGTEEVRPVGSMSGLVVNVYADSFADEHRIATAVGAVVENILASSHAQAAF